MLGKLLQRLFVGPYSATILSEGTGKVPFVTASNALRYTPVYRAVSLISSDCARVELEVSSAGAESLLANPSPFMSSHEFRRSIPVRAHTSGEGEAQAEAQGLPRAEP